MKIQWTGTAGFKIQSRDASFLIDPYLSRNARAWPVQTIKPKDLAPFSHIFVSHGHFDHILDIPDIVNPTDARVVCAPVAGQTLIKMGMARSHLMEIKNCGDDICFAHIQATAFFSRHIRFDAKLLISTLIRAGKQIKNILPLLKNYPCGQVLSWRFELEGKRILFFGTGGSTRAELEILAKDPVDLLLVPLQGHSDICARAMAYVKALKPAFVLPHHQDDFFPPVSRAVDITPFIKQVNLQCPGTKIVSMDFNDTIEL